MSDLPTLYREVCGCPDHSWCDTVAAMPKGSIPTQHGWMEPVTEPLLTREEAANDPEVRRMVHDSIAAKWAWLNETEVTDDDIETQTPWKMHDWNLGKGGTDDE